jgi:hypothetical protein
VVGYNFEDKVHKMFDFLKKKVKEEHKENKPKVKAKHKSAKEQATEAGEPYISVISVELDPDDVGNGAFELDWNEVFVARLVKAGYMQKRDDTDAAIVDRWFQSVCRNILNENFEQWEANQPIDAQPRRVDRNDLGNGRAEIS